MRAVENDESWDLTAVTTGKAVQTVPARDIFRQIAEAAWECADPGMQFDTTINRWHTTPNAGRISASNPCSEYMHLDNSACNLASINLLHYLNDDFSFDIEAFKHTVEVMFTAQEILVGYSEYPTKRITKNARAYRELGLGYANLGALLMAQGLPYDSDEGRAQAAAITALMTGHAYATSAKIAKVVGPFAGYHNEQEGVNNVLRMHRDEVKQIDPSVVSEELLSAAAASWDEAVELGERYGVRNSQATLLAPTGTIGLMMDCDTTGIEPDLGLVKVKKLVGGGTMFIVNQTVPRALKALGYNRAQIEDIINYIDIEKSIIGAPHLKDEHLPVFACSMGDNAIHYMGHVKMMSAVQPFLSGAISKTVNMPEEVTVEEVEQLHLESWKLGLKAVAIYRDNCKVAQPLSMAKKEGSEEKELEVTAHTAVNVEEAVKEAVTEAAVKENVITRTPVRRELPQVRNSKIFKFTVGGVRGYAIVGEYDDGTPGELFISSAKMGSTLHGIMDAFGVSVSYGLQFGVPLKQYVRNFIHTSFAPAGITDDPEIKTASSIIDYIFRKLGQTYLNFDDRLEVGLATLDDMPEGQASLLEDVESIEPAETIAQVDQQVIAEPIEPVAASTAPQPSISASATTNEEPVKEAKAVRQDDSAPLCYNCGNQTQRAGTCYVCTACGSTTGCS
jgi:ribonucleoside-diphosphate reductase alpha chain